MVCGKLNRNISFNQFYELGYFQLFTTMFKLLVILFITFSLFLKSKSMFCEHYFLPQVKNIKGFLVLSDLLNPAFEIVAKKILNKSRKIIK